MPGLPYEQTISVERWNDENCEIDRRMVDHHTTINFTIFMQLAMALAWFSSRHASFNQAKQKWSYKRRNKSHKCLRKTKEKGNRVTTNGPTKNRVFCFGARDKIE